MPKVKLILNNGYVQYNCPGCKNKHYVRVIGNEHPVWQFNGDLEKPTITPSVNCLPYTNPETGQKLVLHCHHFITEGNIVFCGDCDHELAGKTIPLTDIE